MNKRNEEAIKIIKTLDECGYEVIEIKPQYERSVEGVGLLFPTKRLFLRIEPAEKKGEEDK